MSPEHEQQVRVFQEVLEEDSRVAAVWLEGSLARKEDDDYSDIDLWIAIKDSHFNTFIKERETFAAKCGQVLSVLYPYILEPAEDVDSFQILFHDQPPSMSVDVYVQKASRPVRIAPDSRAEEAMVVFDKDGIIKKRKLALDVVEKENEELFEDIVRRFWHMLPRVRTYIERGDIVEAISHYNDRVLDLVALYRMIDAPERMMWGVKDIEYDLPDAAVKTIYNLQATPNEKQLLKLTKKLAMLFSKQSERIGKARGLEVPTALAKQIIQSL